MALTDYSSFSIIRWFPSTEPQDISVPREIMPYKMIQFHLIGLKLIQLIIFVCLFNSCKYISFVFNWTGPGFTQSMLKLEVHYISLCILYVTLLFLVVWFFSCSVAENIQNRHHIRGFSQRFVPPVFSCIFVLSSVH